MNGLHEYAFDVTLLALRVKAHSLQEAKDKLNKLLDCVTINFAEASVGELNLYEFDGEPANDVNGKIEIGD